MKTLANPVITLLPFFSLWECKVALDLSNQFRHLRILHTRCSYQSNHVQKLKNLSVSSGDANTIFVYIPVVVTTLLGGHLGFVFSYHII